MTLYYLEITDLFSAKIFTIPLEERHTIWIAHPNAKEISKKQYDNVLKYNKYFTASKTSPIR